MTIALCTPVADSRTLCFVRRRFGKRQKKERYKVSPTSDGTKANLDDGVLVHKDDAASNGAFLLLAEEEHSSSDDDELNRTPA